MTKPITTGAVHHLALTVNDLKRSQEFYTGLLGFQLAVELGPTRVILSNGSTLMALTTAPDPGQAIDDDRFSENRVGLDHLSLNVGSMEELKEAARLLAEKGVPCGEIKDLGEGFGICVLAFRDPDNIQLELSAPRA
jgi:catechol 2,3-dioxygenase-like lactoylglutathione lyase family enzyme